MRVYEKYGISPELVERVKRKMKEPGASDRVKLLLNGLTKADLQDKAKVKKLAAAVSREIDEKLTETQSEALVRFVLAQKIDPNNTLHLIKLWGMFR